MIWLQTAVLMVAAAGGSDAVLLDFYTESCPPCRQMMPTVDQLVAAGYPVRRINAAADPATASRFGVDRFPTFLLVADGREIDRVVGLASYDRLVGMFRKASALETQAAVVPADMPEKMPSVSASEGVLPAVASGGGQAASLTPASTAPGPSSSAATCAAPLSTVSPDGSPPANAQLIAATVRLRIEDPTGHSCGTGTIVDARGGWALILTCGHLFRDSRGNGPIDVELFGPDGPKRVRGELVRYDSETADVGLVKIRVPGRVCVAPIAPPDHKIEVGSAVASVGCSNGADPTVVRTRIRAKSVCNGSPRLQADGLPVLGRSGGGLFSSEGYVIGVCNFADPTYNAGLYAALESIHSELDRVGLSYVYQRPSTQPTDRWAPLSTLPQGEMVAVAPPEMPAAMPAPSAPGNVTPADPVPTSVRQAAPPNELAAIAPASVPLAAAACLPGNPVATGLSSSGGPGNLSPAEIAALEEIQRRRVAGAEVIVIIRSPNDPTGKSEILRLESASPAFLSQLTAEASRDVTQPRR
jgi:thiol-disulfide isomerase/thioredoxin